MACGIERRLQVLLTVLMTLSSLISLDGSAWALTGEVATDGGDRALKLGDYATAESLLTDALRNTDSPQQSSLILAELGEALLWQGKFSAALNRLSKALSQAQKAYGSDSLPVARILDTMSWVYEALAKQSKAEEFCRRGLEIRTELAAGQPELAESLEHLGFLMDSKGDLGKAQAAYQQALDIRRAIPSEDGSPMLSNLLERLASVEYRNGNNTEAQRLFGQSIQERDKLKAALQPFAPHNVRDTVIYRFLAGAPYCSREDAGRLETINTEGLTVEASLSISPDDYSKTSVTSVRVINTSNQKVQILPQPPELIIMSPKVRMAKLIPNDQVAETVLKQGEKKAKHILFFGANASTPVMTTAFPSAMAPFGYGYAPPGFGHGMIGGGYGGPGFFAGPVTYTTQVPDYEAQAQAYQKADETVKKSAAEAQAIRQQALGAGSLQPGYSIEGTLHFDDTKFKEAVLRIPIGNAIFEFLFGG